MTSSLIGISGLLTAAFPIPSANVGRKTGVHLQGQTAQLACSGALGFPERPKKLQELVQDFDRYPIEGYWALGKNAY